MPAAGTATFFDGKTTARHDVRVDLAPKALRIRATGGALLAEWPYDEIAAMAAPEGVLRLGKVGNSPLARLEVRDPQLAAAIDERSHPVDRSGAGERRMRRKVVVWSLAATASLLAVAIIGVPEIATRLTPLVPWQVEGKLGAAINAQTRSEIDTRKLGAAFECGNEEPQRAGRAAFAKLVAQIEAAAALPIPLTVTVVRRSEANAFALPGGYIYVFQGLIDQAQSPDEIAGVIAHEAGHVAHRDNTRAVLNGAALSFMLGMLLGDFVGGGAVVYASKSLLKTSYTRTAEAQADAYAVTLMQKMGANPRALGLFLTRIAGGTSHPGPKLLIDHPEPKERVAAIEAMSGSAPTRPVLGPTEWADLKRICAGHEPS